MSTFTPIVNQGENTKQNYKFDINFIKSFGCFVHLFEKQTIFHNP